MDSFTVNICQCDICKKDEDHPEKVLHQRMNLFMSRLNEQQRRWYAALESWHAGRGGIRYVSQITGLSEKTIRRGRNELSTWLAERPIERVRQQGAGRPKQVKDASSQAESLTDSAAKPPYIKSPEK